MVQANVLSHKPLSLAR